MAVVTATLDDAATGVVIPFNSGTDDYGVEWLLTDLDGWDSPDLEENAQSRAGQDGLWDAENWFGGRTLTIKGLLTASSAAERQAAEYRLRQALPRNRLITFTVDEATPKWVKARRSGRLMTAPKNEVHAEFSISMLAVDPRKYGVTPVQATISVAAAGGGLAPPWTPPVLIPASTSGASTATLTNAGIYDSPPIITIHGPGSGISIYNFATSLLLSYDLNLGVTDYLVVDVAAGVALLNGTAPRPPASGSSVTSQFLVAPGDNLMQIFGTLTTATPPSADISFYSAWT